MATEHENLRLTAQQLTDFRSWLARQRDLNRDRAAGRAPGGSRKSASKQAETADDLLRDLDRILELPHERSGCGAADVVLSRGFTPEQTLAYARILRRLSRELPYDSDYEAFATSAKYEFLRVAGVSEAVLEGIDPLVRPPPVPGPGDDATPLCGLGRAQAMELWFWLWSGAESRLREWSPGYAARWFQRLREDEASACLRILEAFERSHRDESSSWYGIHDLIGARLARGLDPEGVLLFSRYLVQQTRYWGERSAPGRPERIEAATRLPIVKAASALFHRLLGATPEEVERRGKFVKRERGALGLGFGIGKQVIEDLDEGPIPREEREERMRRARPSEGGTTTLHCK